jgi:hypothetical protein
MEEQVPSSESKKPSLSEISFPTGEPPVAHPVRFYDPRAVAAHFADLPVPIESAEQRWARKANATPFPGV